MFESIFFVASIFLLGVLIGVAIVSFIQMTQAPDDKPRLKRDEINGEEY